MTARKMTGDVRPKSPKGAIKPKSPKAAVKAKSPKGAVKAKSPKKALKSKSPKNGRATKSRRKRTVPSCRSILQFTAIKHPASSSPVATGAVSTPCGNQVRPGEQNLRQEAVLAAQENARLHAGKATHPFFVRKKSSSLFRTSIVQIEDVHPGPPIHVTQLPLSESTDMNWKNWEFGFAAMDKGVQTDISGGMEQRSFMKHLRFSALSEQPVPEWHAHTTTSSNVVESSAGGLDGGGSCLESTPFSLEALEDFLRKTKRSGTETLDEQGVSPVLSVESLKNRFSWYVTRHETQNSLNNASLLDGEAASSSLNLLWTDKYQPKSSEEVCGNASAVDVLRTWLNSWQQKINGQPIKVGEVSNVIEADGVVDSDSDRGWFEDDDDSNSDLDDESNLHNTLLVTGPEGCGKSSAIYACAGEQGFTVLEVSASDYRNGALIKHKFGEAMESHCLGKTTQVNAESPVAGDKQASRLCNNSSPEPSKEKVGKKKNGVGGKRRADWSPLKTHQLASDPSPDESVLASQSRRKTVILFEDVDKHFEEDKGFLSALVQLSRVAKRPIILTSNRIEPGLPAVLEKCRIHFRYPSSEELVLHSCLICGAEDTLCSPWFMEHLVDSCQFDVRKIMMTLQFWGQGRKLVRQPSVIDRIPGGILRSTSDFSHDRYHTCPAKDRLSLGRRRTLSLAGTSKLSLGINQEKDPFQQWDSDARWLFELDVHHFILPKLISASLECSLSLFIAEKLCTAVNELDDHAAQVAASETEERARTLQAKFEASERICTKDEKLKIWRRSEMETRISTDEIVSSLSANGDTKGADYHSDSALVCSPTGSLRQAKTLARSPLRSKILKSRRALLLSDSDDEQTQPTEHLEACTRTVSTVETLLQDAQMIAVQSQVNIASPEKLQDLDVTNVCGSPVKGKRKRLRKVRPVSHDLLPGHETSDSNGQGSGSLNFQADAVALERQVFKCKSVPQILLDDTCNPVVDLDESDSLALPFNPLKRSRCGITCDSKEGLAEVSQVQIEDQHASLVVAYGEGCSYVGESVPSSALLPQLSCREEVGVTGAGAQVNNAGARLAENAANGLEESQRGMSSVICIDSEGQSAAGPGVVSVDSTVNIGFQRTEGFASEAFDPVTDMWKSLRDSRALKSMPNRLHSGDYTDPIFDLLDVISAADVISSVETEEYKAARAKLGQKMSEALSENIGHCNDWDGCQEIASQLVDSGLRHSLASLPTIKHLNQQVPLLASIMEGANDAAAVGKCMAKFSCLSRKVDDAVTSNCPRLHSTRQADREIRLEEMFNTAIAPKVRVSRSGVVEYCAYLSLICEAEETRRTQGFTSEGRRPRRFEHYLNSKLSLSKVDIEGFKMGLNLGKLSTRQI